MVWEQLLTVNADRRSEHHRQKTEAPVACPNDGTVLDSGPHGVLHCPFDGWQWPRDADLSVYN